MPPKAAVLLLAVTIFRWGDINIIESLDANLQVVMRE